MTQLEEYREKSEVLSKYLKKYLSKYEIRMKKIMISMINHLDDENHITLKQLRSVMKWIERERKFKGMDRSDINKYFEVLTKPIVKEISYVSLDTFIK